MQNKANVKIGNITISIVATKPYANEQRTMNNERYSKQTQSNPISNAESQFQTQFSGAKNRTLRGSGREGGGEVRG